jgi:hypothetical protein
VNSPSDVEIDNATRDSNGGTLSFVTNPISDFQVLNTVINGINPKPSQLTSWRRCGERATGGN